MIGNSATMAHPAVYRPRHAMPGARPRPIPRIAHTARPSQHSSPARTPTVPRPALPRDLPEWCYLPSTAMPSGARMLNTEFAAHIRDLERQHRANQPIAVRWRKAFRRPLGVTIAAALLLGLVLPIAGSLLGS